MKALTLKLALLATTLVAVMTSCSNTMDESKIDADRLCALADAAFAKKDFSDLLPELEKQFHVDAKNMRIAEQGIFIPLKGRFVEESGYFLARPGANIILKVGDPVMSRVKGCLFLYRIKG